MWPSSVSPAAPTTGAGRPPHRGRRLAVFVVASVTLALAGFGPDFLLRPLPPPAELELELTLPDQPANAHEPLVCTGTPGHADFLYINHLGGGTVTVGYDSWGAGGPTSPPFKLEPGEPVRLRLRLPAIAQLTAGQSAPTSTLTFALEGQPEWVVPVHSHVTRAAEIHWASNRIGGTSCADAFSGELRRPGGHRVSGLGGARYYGFTERLAAWWPRVGWLAALYATLALAGGAAAAWGINWPTLVARVRAFLAGLGQRRPGEPVPRASRADPRPEGCAWLAPLPAKPFLLGFVLAFASCIGAGWYLGRQPLFRGFVRFFQSIQPQTQFYPTVRELVSYVERTVPRDKILVLVGGASYFRGTGQNPGELWTHELQRRLGDEYAVVNYGIDQAGPPAFAGVVFQILAQRYPRAIYVCNGGVLTDAPLDGGGVYRYLYWDAYYKDLLPEEPGWEARVQAEIARQTRTQEGQELHLGKRLDAYTYACALWTWVGYHGVFTVWADSYPRHPFRARGRYVERDDPNLRATQRAQRQGEYAKLMEERGRATARTGWLRDPAGKWVQDPALRLGIAERYDRMLPPSVRAKSLVVLLHGNPYFQRHWTAGERRRWKETYNLAEQVIGQCGYQVVQAGADFTPDDYVDAGHFMASGGQKIAAIVADKILALREAE
ncbi:hypothetical protein [Opitutus sp. ER46]|uniref:hypothetical protein n=1 Tax=Opitutus sp. ER46 TaxID=2161864 RepID=UPI000D2F6CBD|nr:hypothetical protein [Opitutus sp. ER46]PTX98390.1 hypothetical protein DB354_03735 [Opitutus sp. ER46]